MTDVRLTVTTEDGEVVPVAATDQGRLLLHDPNDFDGYLDGDLTVTGSATFAGNVLGNRIFARSDTDVDTLVVGKKTGTSIEQGAAIIRNDGSATFAGDVTVTGSAEFAGRVGINTPPNAEARFACGGTIAGNGLTITSDITDINASSTIQLNGSDGSASFAGRITGSELETGTALTGGYGFYASEGNTSNGKYGACVVKQNTDDTNSNAAFTVRKQSSVSVSINYDGSALFVGDVVIGSRGSKWKIVESGGIAHLIQETSFLEADQDSEYPELRNLPRELDLIEQALAEVMDKLRMVPPAGFPVWDGSDENS